MSSDNLKYGIIKVKCRYVVLMYWSGIMKSDKELFTIGEISKICDIPVKTLRYYDEISLLKPEKVDDENNYRYYSKQQILHINIIKDFKMMGFSLRDISSLIKREDLRLLQEKLTVKLEETLENIKNLEYMKLKLKEYIDIIDQGRDILDTHVEKDNEIAGEYKVEVKDIPLSWVVYTRYRCPCNPNSFIIRYGELYQLIEKYNLHRSGPLLAIYHDHYTQFSYDDADIEVCLIVAEEKRDCPAVKQFGGFTAALTLHKGSYKNMVNGYKALMDYISKNGYEVDGPASEKYIIDAGSTLYEENYVTELIIPIKKQKNS